MTNRCICRTALVLLTICTAAWWYLREPGFALVCLEEARALAGGDPGPTPIPRWCIQTNTTCPDPGGVPTTCTYDATTMKCRICTMIVPNWPNCKSVGNPSFMCGELISPTNPFCAEKKIGDPDMGTTNCAGKYTTAAGACGQQIPTVGGIPCP
jgi:hypothetical protein